MLVVAAGVLENEERIIEYGGCFFERNTMPVLILRSLQLVPRNVVPLCSKRRSMGREA